MTTLTSVHISPKPRLLPPDVQSRSLRTVLEDTHTSDFEVQYDIPVDRDLYNLAPSLGLPCGSTNGCTLNHYGTVLVRQFAKPGPAVYKPPPAKEPLVPLHVTPRSRHTAKDLVESCPTFEPEMRNGIASVGDPCDHLHLPRHVHAPALAYESATSTSTATRLKYVVLAAAIDQVGGIIGIIPVETYRMHGNNMQRPCIPACRDSHVDRFFITAVIRS